MNNLVPDGWEATDIGELTKTKSLFKDGDWVESKDQDPFGNNRLIQLADIGDGRFINKSSRFMNEEQFARLKCTELQKGDILVARMPEPLGRACIYPLENIKAATIVDIAIIRTTNADHYWLMSAINSSEFRYNIDLNASGTTRTRIARGALAKLKLIAPPLLEQQKIAKILTSVDEVIEKTQAQIDKLKDLKTGMMQELLTNGVGHTEFKDSPVGRIPAKWEVVKLDKLISTMDGGVSVNSENKQKAKGQFGILKTSSIAKGKFFPSKNKAVLAHEVNRLKTPVLSDHIIFSRMNTPALVGESGYITQNYDDLFLPDRLWQIDVKCRKETNVLWLSYVLASNKLKAEISELATGTSNTMKNISKPKLLSIKIACPEFEEQVNISKSLKSIDTKLDIISSKLEKLKGTKKALMQDLLTGKVRVKTETTNTEVAVG
ncbi:MAG: restriction endonuclease subunit S [Alteromonadaceae bacterium]